MRDLLNFAGVIMVWYGFSKTRPYAALKRYLFRDWRAEREAAAIRREVAYINNVDRALNRRRKAKKPLMPAYRPSLKTPEGQAKAMMIKIAEREISIEKTNPVAKVGPRVITLGFEPGENFDDKSFKNNDFQIICRTLKQNPENCRFVPQLPGKYRHYVGIETPRDARTFEPIQIATVIASAAYKEAAAPVALGVNTFGDATIMDLADARNAHVFIAGTTGSGKTTLVLGIIDALLRCKYRPQLVMIDAAKGGEDLEPFMSAPDQFAPFVDNYDAALATLQQLASMLDQQRKNARRIIVVIDEFPDMIDQSANPHAKKCIAAIERIARLGRSKRIHLILLSQSASAEKISEGIRNNVKGRVALLSGPGKQTEQILGPGWGVDASKLCGHGDMFAVVNGSLERIQSPLPSESEIAEWIAQHGMRDDYRYPFDWRTDQRPAEMATDIDPAIIAKAARAVIDGYLESGKCPGRDKIAATTGEQSRFVGAKVLPELERIGVVSEVRGKSRDVLIQSHEKLTALLSELGAY